MTINSSVEKCQASELTHPYLIIKDSEFNELRNRALHEPWATFKSSAISVALSEYVRDTDAVIDSDEPVVCVIRK